jgi:hypothetical protein
MANDLKALGHILEDLRNIFAELAKRERPKQPSIAWHLEDLQFGILDNRT